MFVHCGKNKIVIIANVANGSYEYLAKFGYYLNMCNFCSGGGHVCLLWQKEICNYSQCGKWFIGIFSQIWLLLPNYVQFCSGQGHVCS
jgi:hypothetical protein